MANYCGQNKLILIELKNTSNETSNEVLKFVKKHFDIKNCILAILIVIFFPFDLFVSICFLFVSFYKLLQMSIFINIFNNVVHNFP